MHVLKKIKILLFLNKLNKDMRKTKAIKLLCMFIMEF